MVLVFFWVIRTLQVKKNDDILSNKEFTQFYISMSEAIVLYSPIHYCFMLCYVP